MATTKTDAQKVAELRKQAMDKSLPQEVRDMADKKANEIEGKSVEKATGMKLAKGGAVKKMMYGGALPVRGERTATNKAKKMAVGGMPVRDVVAPPRDKTKPVPLIRDAVMPKPDKTKMGVAPSPAIIARKEKEKANKNITFTPPMMAKGGAAMKAKKK